MPGSPYTDSQLRAQLSDNEIAGGQPYLDTLSSTEQITEADCDTTVSSGSAFWSAVTGSLYDSIWIADNAAIDISGRSEYVSGKTISGNRGVNGSEGPLLYSTDRGINSYAYGGGDGTGQMTLMNGSRITGVRLRGWAHDYWDNPAYPGFLPMPDGTASQRKAWRDARHARAMNIRSDASVVDNCEIYGWCTQGITCGTSTTGSSPHIHHNDIHDNMMTSFGYHIEPFHGQPLIEYNYMNAHRHAVAGFGPYDSSYIVRYNLFGPATSSHEIDAHSNNNNGRGNTSDYWSTGYHGNAGGRMEVYRNTHTATHVISEASRDAGDWTWAISVRGSPWPRDANGIRIEDNVFEHPEVTENGGGNGIRDPTHNGPYNQQLSSSTGAGFSIPSSQIGSDGFTVNYEHGPNHFNGSTTTYDPTQVGAPINLDGPDPDQPPETAQLRVYPREDEPAGPEIEGAIVSIDPHEDISEWYDGVYEKTAEYEAEYDGVYARWDGLPVGLYDIAAEHPDYETAFLNDLDLNPTGRQPHIVMTPVEGAGATSPLTITVSGNPDAAQGQEMSFSIDGNAEPAKDTGESGR